MISTKSQDALTYRTLVTYWRKYVQPRWEVVEWPLFLSLVGLTVFLGVMGFASYFAKRQELRSLQDCLYLTLQLFTLESGSIPGEKIWSLELARFLAPLLSGYAAIQALMALFAKQLLLIRLSAIKNHTIVCGLGRKGYMFAQDFWRKGFRVVLIEVDANNPFIPMVKALGIPVLIGNGADENLLKQARLSKANHLIAVCGADGVNAEIAISSQAIWHPTDQRTLHCFLHIVDPAVWDMLSGRKFAFDSRSFQMDFFNIYDWGARQALERFPIFHAQAQPASPPHIVIIGLGKFGGSLLIHAARTWFWIIRDMPRPKKLRITIIDTVAKLKIEGLIRRYPQLQDACTLIPMQTDIRWLDARSKDAKILLNRSHPVQQTFVCLDSDSLALHAAAILQNLFTARQTPIIVRMALRAGLATLLSSSPADQADPIKIFPLLDETCKAEALEDYIDVLAKAMHEAYIEQCQRNGSSVRENESLQPWDRLSKNLQNSNREQAHHLPFKLKKIGYQLKPLHDWQADRLRFTDGEVETMAQLEHSRWLEERHQADYKEGPKSEPHKSNPNIKPWHELDERTKDFDRNTVRLIPKFLAQINLQVYRSGKKT